MASVKVFVKLKYEGQTAAFYDISGRVNYEDMSWESNSEGTSANARVPVWTILPKSTTDVSGYSGATFADKLNTAIADESFLIEIPNRAEIRIVDVETSPDTVLFAGIITRISSNRQGGSIIQDVECADNTAILEEHVVADYYAPRDSRDIDVIYGGTTSYTSAASLPTVVGQIDGLSLSSESTGGNLSDGTYEVRAQARNSTMIGRDNATPQYGPVTKSVSLTLSAGTNTQRLKIKWKNPGSANSARIYVKRTSASGSGTQNVEYLGKTVTTLTSQKIITAASRTSNVVEITTSTTHGLAVGDPIVVSIPQTPGFSVSQTDFVLVKAVPSSTKITYDSVGEDGSATITNAFLTSGGSALVGSLSTVESPTVLTSSSARGWADGEIYTVGGNNYRLGVGPNNVRGWLYPISVFGGLFDQSWLSEIDLDTSTYVEAVDTQYRFSPYFQESDTPNAEQYGGRTIRNILDYISEKTGAEYWVDKGSFDGAGNYSCNLHYRAKTPKELVVNGIYDGNIDGWTTAAGFTLGASTSGPYGAGYTVSSSTSNTFISTATANRIPVVHTEKYFISVRAKASDHVNRLDAHYVLYDASGTEISRHSLGNLASAGEWERLWKVINVSNSSAAYIGLLGECTSQQHGSVSFTDWSVIKITGTMGYGDFEDPTNYSVPIYEMEVPSSPVESGNTANRLHLYAVFRTRDSSGNKVALTDTNGNPVQYVDYDFVPGIWATNGKIVEAAITDDRVETLADAELSAEGYWKENGLPIESYTFEMRPRSASDSVYPVPEVGDVIPFIWNTLGVAKPMIVKSVAARMLGMDIVYTITVGGDVRLQRSAFIRLSERIKELDDVNPVPPTPDTPTDLTVSANDRSVSVSWSFDETREVNKKLASFEIQRQDAIFRAIDEISRSGSTVTVTTSVAHGLVPSDSIRIDLEPTTTNIMALEGQWTVGTTTTTSFTFTSLSSGTISTTSVSGYVYYNFTDFRTVQNTKATYVNDSGLISSLQYRYQVRALSTDLTASEFTEPSSPTEPNEPTAVVPDGSITANKLVSSLKAIEIISGPTLPSLPSASYPEGTIVYHLDGTPPGLRKVGISGSWENAIGASDIVANSITAGLISAAGIDASVIKSGALVIDSRFGAGNLKDVSFKAQSGTTATLTTTVAHGYSAGQTVKVTNIGAPFDGSFTILSSPAPTATKFSYTVGTSATVAETEVSPYGAALVNTGTNAITSSNFTVSNTGIITASGADISGTITAQDGQIGGWSIGSSSVTNYGGSSGQYVGISDTSGSSGLAFFAGATSAAGAGAKFSVTNNGDLTSTSATVTGGSFNINSKFIVDSSGNLTGYGSKFNPSGVPAITLQGNSNEGDIAIPDGNRLDIGHTNTSTNVFQIGARMSSARNWTFYGDVTVNGTLTATVGSYVLADGSVTTAKLADAAVTTAKIASGAVNTAALATDSVTSDKIAASAVTSSEIASGAVGTTELAALAVTADKIATSAVTTAKISDANVTNAKIADGAINSAKIASGAVNNAALATDAVTADKIAAGAVGTSEIAASAVDSNELAAGAVTSTKLGASSITSATWDPNTAAGGTAGNCIWTTSGTRYLFARQTGSTSEAKFKKEIIPFQLSSEVFSQLKFVQFKYDRDAFIANGQTDIIVPEETQYGLIIDELETVAPGAINLVGPEAPNKTINWDYIRNIQGVALQDALSRIAALESRIAELEG